MKEHNLILLVDDVPESLAVLVGCLSAEGFQILPADSGELALLAAEARHPDLILLDIRMPGMDGFEVCRRLKANAATRDIPVIFLTAATDIEDRVEGFRLGAVDYIAKPFQREECLARIRTHLDLSRLNVALREKSAELEETNLRLEQEVSERWQEHERLKESEERYRTTLLGIGDGVITTDAEGRVRLLNAVAETLTGWTSDEARGKPMTEVFRIINEDTRQPVENPVAQVLASGKIVGLANHTLLIRRDGMEFPIADSGAPIKNDRGEILGVVLVFSDQTKERAARKEQEKLQSHLRQSQKLEAIGTLAGGIAHDFNNILAAILGYAELARESAGPQSKVGRDLDQVIKASRRAADLVRQILTLSRQSEPKLRRLHIRCLVKEALKLLRPSISTSIDITSNIDADCPLILGDPTEVHQVVMNLCTNAYHAMRDKGGRLHIDLAAVAMDQEELKAQSLHLQPGRYVRLSVSDTGCGMDAATREKIFEPYFTTKEQGEGTGLGLAVVHGIVTGYGGGISVESAPGQGSDFQVYFPVSEEHAPEPLEQPCDTRMPRGTETIMVVDDEEPIVELLHRTFTLLGYRVVVHAVCDDAMIDFNSQPEAFDLIITDMNMPKVMGTDLARAFLEIRPDIPIILCTGFSEKVDLEKARAIGIKEMVFKPVNREALAQLVRKTLDEALAEKRKKDALPSD